MMQKSRYKVLLFLIGILLLTNGALLLFFVGNKPEEKRHPRPDRSALMREFLKDSVRFDEQQLAQFDQMREKHREHVKSLFEDIRTAKISFYKQVNQESVADSVNRAAASVIAERQKALDLAFFGHFRQVRALCRPEQLPKYDSLVQQIVRRMVSSPRRGDSKQKKEDKAERK